VKENQQSPESIRVINALNELVRLGIVKTFYQLAKQLGLNQTFLTDLTKGRKDATMPFINMIVSRYNINRDYIYLGRYPIINEPNLVIDLKALRESRGSSQEEFASFMGIDVQTLENIENYTLGLSKENYEVLITRFGEKELVDFMLESDDIKIKERNQRLKDLASFIQEPEENKNKELSESDKFILLNENLKTIISSNAKLIDNNEKLINTNTRLADSIIKITEQYFKH